MAGSILFEWPAAWWLVPAAAAVLIFATWKHRRRGLNWPRACSILSLRAAVFVLFIFLAARPVWTTRQPPAPSSRTVALLVDRSESMSLREHDRSRYQQALDFSRSRLLPALKSANLPVRALLFDEATEAADGEKLQSVLPRGKRTNLGRAIAESLADASRTPLAVIALTDGDANESSDNTRALTRLADAAVPFIGVGFGSDQGVQTLSLREVEAPAVVPTKSSFTLAAHLETMNADAMPAFDLVLFRDGQVAQKKSVAPGKGSRTWLENFELTEEKQGLHNYSVQVAPPNVANLKCVNLLANASVRISDEKEIRVLYVQGALTWDYKFIGLALHNDQTIKMTGLTRTSKEAVFRQNVESAGEFLNGFPTSVEELAPFRVVVLSNLKPSDLTAAQQEILARFCGEMGGGLLMIGGPATFDSSWQSSRLEQLLPVVFAGNAGVEGLDRPFKIELTDDALQHPIFQIADNTPVKESWERLPTFTQYGRVDAVKPGAQIWLKHQNDDGPQGRRVLMASQRYGAGISTVLSIQNFWRWRLAKDTEAPQFDRFWRQLFRYLSDAGRQDISIHLADQDLHPRMDVQVVLEKQPNPKNLMDKNSRFIVRVENSKKELLHEEAVDLEPLHPVDFKFHAEKADTYSVTVTDPLKVPLAARPVEIRDVNVEFQNTARNMETLRQWASVSEGLAFKQEECPDAMDLVAQIKSKIEQVRRGKTVRQAFGVNGWVMFLALGLLGTEYGLRKRWNLN